jgi:hypothetical protein
MLNHYPPFTVDGHTYKVPQTLTVVKLFLDALDRDSNSEHAQGLRMHLEDAIRRVLTVEEQRRLTGVER